jgi:hypothetical protein
MRDPQFITNPLSWPRLPIFVTGGPCYKSALWCQPIKQAVWYGNKNLESWPTIVGLVAKHPPLKYESHSGSSEKVGPFS